MGLPSWFYLYLASTQLYVKEMDITKDLQMQLMPNRTGPVVNKLRTYYVFFTEAGKYSPIWSISYWQWNTQGQRVVLKNVFNNWRIFRKSGYLMAIEQKDLYNGKYVGMDLWLQNQPVWFTELTHYYITSGKKRSFRDYKQGDGSLFVTFVSVGRQKIIAVAIPKGKGFMACQVFSYKYAILTNTESPTKRNGTVDELFLLDQRDHLRCRLHPGFALGVSNTNKTLQLVRLGGDGYLDGYNFDFPDLVEEIAHQLGIPIRRFKAKGNTRRVPMSQ